MAKHELFDSPKFKLLVQRLGVSRALVVGHLELLWQTCHRKADGLVGTAEMVEAAAEWEGDSGVFFDALWAEGQFKESWLDQVDEGIFEIHDYEDHMPHHLKERFRKRASKGKKKKSLPEIPGKVLPTPTSTSTSIGHKEANASSSMSVPLPDVDWIFKQWNECAATYGLTQCRTISTERRKLAQARLAEHGEGGIQSAFNEISQSDLLQGNTKRGWKPTIDWFLKKGNMIKTLDGNYRERRGRGGFDPDGAKRKGEVF